MSCCGIACSALLHSALLNPVVATFHRSQLAFYCLCWKAMYGTFNISISNTKWIRPAKMSAKMSIAMVCIYGITLHFTRVILKAYLLPLLVYAFNASARLRLVMFGFRPEMPLNSKCVTLCSTFQEIQKKPKGKSEMNKISWATKTHTVIRRVRMYVIIMANIRIRSKEYDIRFKMFRL